MLLRRLCAGAEKWRHRNPGMQYIYIHGFNSGVQSRSGAALEELLGEPVVRVQNDYSQPFEYCLRKTEEQIQAAGQPHEDLCILGTSLGGFYATQLRLPGIKQVITWNPVIFPALQLGKFTGENTRFTDGKKWHFSREALLSYAMAADPRIWKNFAWRKKYASIDDAPDRPDRIIFLGDRDEVLDHEIAAVFWEGHAPVHIISSGHSIENFEHILDYLR